MEPEDALRDLVDKLQEAQYILRESHSIYREELGESDPMLILAANLGAIIVQARQVKI